MQVDSLITLLVERSGYSDRRMSLELGKCETWTRNTKKNASDPRIGTVADVADVCNCDVCIIDRDTGAVVATVTPPRRAGDGA